MGVFSQVYEYFRLLRVYNHGNFVVVLAGAAFFDRVASLADILMLYLSFNIFLYGGIYTMNAVTDYESDRANPAKRGRPIASGAISVAAGSVFMLLSWAFAFASSYFYFGSTKFFVYYAGFLAVNVAYSFYFKKAKYIRFLFVALTSPLRIHMGAALSGIALRPTATLMAYAFMSAVQVTKLRAEKDKFGDVVYGWPPHVLELICLVAIAVGDYDLFKQFPVYCGVVTAAFLLFVGVPNAKASTASVLVGADMVADKTNKAE